MKWLSILLCLFLLTLMLLFPAASTAAAQDAVGLWLTRVLPALFPYYVAASLLTAGGLFTSLSRRCRWAAFPLCFLLGAVSGYPVGARLACLAGREDWSACCNLSSPAFLTGVIAVGMLGDARFAAPLALAHYGAALLSALLDRLLLPRGRDRDAGAAAVPEISLPAAIGEGMLAMLKIGGCILFFSVCSGLLQEALHMRAGLPAAILTGLLEITAGSNAMASLPLPPRLLCAGLAAMVSLGGLSVLIQARSVSPGLRILPYVIAKLFQASAAFLIAFFAAPLLCREACEVFSSRGAELLDNASALAALLLAAGAGMSFSYLFALVTKAARSRIGAGR
ncbi:MAG: hypothetical protein Q4C13_08120 [Clostridia bacterium]|nr:hypothetical protein [Clostridia bacterium]